jgi:phage/conjugal plasmid C-4 type zinc finger TraR family protein
MNHSGQQLPSKVAQPQGGDGTVTSSPATPCFDLLVTMVRDLLVIQNEVRQGIMENALMDEIDIAQKNAENFTASSLHRALMADRYNDEDPLIIDGLRCCLDCEKPIPQKRLEVHPGAKRCVECQEKEEKRR